MNSAWGLPGYVVKEGSYQGEADWQMFRGKPGAITVNKYGERFMNEGVAYHPALRAWYFYDTGNDNYRNLRPDPTKTGLTPINITTVQTNRANGSNPAQVYVPGNVIYKSGVSKWCGQCHGAPTHHSIDKAVDYTIWAAVTLPRVPVLSPSDNAIPSADDQVICVSCHKAHGSDNNASLIYADGVAIDSTCQECHNQ